MDTWDIGQWYTLSNQLATFTPIVTKFKLLLFFHYSLLAILIHISSPLKYFIEHPIWICQLGLIDYLCQDITFVYVSFVASMFSPASNFRQEILLSSVFPTLASHHPPHTHASYSTLAPLKKQAGCVKLCLMRLLKCPTTQDGAAIMKIMDVQFYGPQFKSCLLLI